MSLTDLNCKNFKPRQKSYKKGDSLGLYLEIQPNGSKYWRLKYRYAQKDKCLALGVYPQITLLEAREKRDAARKLLADRKDPATVRKELRQAVATNAATTFELVALEWHENMKARWSPEHGKDILHRIKKDVFPMIGKLPIADIKPLQVLATLRKIEKRGAHETARRASQYCGQIFRYAVITERASRDITIDLKGALQPFKHGHFAAIEIDDIPDFIRTLERNDARLFTQTRNALKLLMLTFVRTSELIEASWEEIDFETAQWTIPAERMKMRRPHIVPLSKQVLATFREQHKLTGNWDWIFPNQAYPQKCMSNNTILKALGRLGYKGRMTGHGFRALAMSTIKERLNYRHEVVDRQLAHAPATKNDRAYDRAKFLDERRKMMQDWADYLDDVTKGGDVIHVDFVKTAKDN